MKLTRLEITQLPGIRPGFALSDFAPEINVITGPNASGKSSLIRSLRFLVDESPKPADGAVTLAAELADDDARWSVVRTGSNIEWKRDGQRAERPSLPPGEYLSCYWLSMDDLLTDGETEDAIVEQVRRELSGGFDVDAIRDELFSLGKRHGQSEHREFLNAQRALRAVEQEYESLDRERNRLPEMDRTIAEADAAAGRCETLRRALELLEARRERRAAEERLKKFPSGMELLAGDEAERLQELERKRANLLVERGRAEDERGRAQNDVEASGLAREAPSQPQLEAGREDLAEVSRIETRISQITEQLDKARAAERNAAADLGGERPEGPTLTPGTVNRAATMAEQLLRAQRTVEELETATAAKAPDEATVKAHETVAEELRRWLRSLDSARARRLVVAGAAAGLGAVLAGVAAWWAGANWGIAPALVAAAASVWSIAQLIGLNRTRLEAQRRVAEQPVDPPERWTVPAVAARLAEVEERLAALRREVELARRAEARRQELEDARVELARLEAEKDEIAREAGFDPATTGAGVERFVRLVAAIDQARAERAELEGRIERERTALEERLDRLVALLRAFGGLRDGPLPDPTTVRSEFAELERRVGRLEEARRALAQSHKEQERIDREIAEIDRGIEQLYTGVELPVGSRADLLERCDRVGAYRAECDRLREARIREQDRAAGLPEDDETEPLIEADDEAKLRERLEQAEAEAQRATQLREERAKLQARLEHAGSDRKMEEARRKYDRAREALEQAYDRALLRESGNFLLHEVSEEHRSEHEPRIVTEARDRFARYTHYAYELIVDQGRGIVAEDRTAGEKRSLQELSTGTRMQLLMAVRLGYLSVLERSYRPLPLFLDEALTTTDPERFEEIVGSLKDAAHREGRQLFYLSAQPADLLRWEEAIGARPHHIDLPMARFGMPGCKPEDYPMPVPRSIPEPGEMSPAEYAATLEVPPVDPRRDAGSIHLFYLVRDDLPLLHRLMNTLKIASLGALEQFLRREDAAELLPEEDRRRRLAARCRIARIWAELWRQGRGHPVDRSALERSGAVTEAFLDAVWELCERVNGDAVLLIESLRAGHIARFRRQKVDELAEWLEEHGYLDSAERLSPEARRRELRRRAGDGAPAGEVEWVCEGLEAQVSADWLNRNR